MANKNKKNFKTVNKIFEPADYNSTNESSEGLAVTHEQANDVYTVGDITTHDPDNQFREKN